MITNCFSEHLGASSAQMQSTISYRLTQFTHNVTTSLKHVRLSAVHRLNRSDDAEY